MNNPTPASDYPDNNPKTRVGQLKPSTWAIPRAALYHLGCAMRDGMRKYGIFNWREKRVSASVYADAIDRHLGAFIDGEDYATDSGCHHLAHVMACCAILLDAKENGTLNDDRGPKGPLPDLLARWHAEAVAKAEEDERRLELDLTGGADLRGLAAREAGDTSFVIIRNEEAPPKRCPHVNDDGVCPFHNLQCGYPDCEKEV